MASTQGARVFRFGSFEVDLGNRQLLKNGVSVSLRGQPFDVLVLLLEHAGQLVTRDQLCARLWPSGTVVEFDHSIHAAVTRLREALDEDAEHPRFVATVPRHGYRFIAPVSTVALAAIETTTVDSPRSHAVATEGAPEGSGFQDQFRGRPSSPDAHDNTARSSSDDQSALPAPPRAVRPFDPRLPAIIVGAALVLTYVAVDKFWVSTPSRAAQPVSSLVHRAVAPAVDSAPTAAFDQPPSSIAVLPLANDSGDPSQQYFSDGLSEDLITALSQFPGLKVIGRTSSFQFRGAKEDSRTIGTKLGVAHLLEGSVRRSGEVVRVSVALVDTADASTQWSERYDRPYKDLFALQDEITRAVAEALRMKLLPGERVAMQSERPPGGSLEAYNAMLQGRFYYSRYTKADVHKAIEFYTQATQLDPSYAVAWSGQSISWTALGEFIEPAQGQFAKAREAAARALALSPDLAEAHMARGYLLQVADFDWRGAEAEFRRALALAPDDGRAKNSLATQLATFGELEPAIELTRQALIADPLQAGWYANLGAYLMGLNRLDEAERALRRALDLQPAAVGIHGLLLILEIQRGNATAALEAAKREPSGIRQDFALAQARQIGDDRSAADAALRTLLAKYANGAAYAIAQVYALREDTSETFAWLDRAWSNRDTGIPWLLYDPFISRYKDDPRFAAFCRKVRLPVPGESQAHAAL